MIKYIAAILLGLVSITGIASPVFLITHNTTNVESNAYVGGVVPSPRPTLPNSVGKVHWSVVRVACYGRLVNNKCSALIKMATNTSNPIELGYVTVDIDSGDISPKQISGGGYTLTVIGPGETLLSTN